MDKMEMLCRAWIECDPNRGGVDPDEIMGRVSDGSSDGPSVSRDTPLTGKPRWEWFRPRAEALDAYLVERGWKIVSA